MEKQLALEMRGITKRFGSVTANRNINLDIYRGEILSLLGENGCGKTTLMNMISGLYYPDEGQLYMDGEEVVIRSPRDAFDHKIGMIHQHFKLVDLFTAAQNIVLGIQEEGRYNLKEVNARVREIADRYGFRIDPEKKIYEMSVSEKQTVEIIKVLYRGAELLILDEPTAVLTPQEIDELMQIMRNLAAEGKSILFISHKLAEIMAVADRCTVLRKGKYIGTVETKNTTMEQLSAMMVGRNVNFHVEKKPATPGEVVLDVEGLTVVSKGAHKKDAVKNVSFQVRAGEIVCIAGIDGNGQSEFVYGLSGLEPLVSGRMVLVRSLRYSVFVDSSQSWSHSNHCIATSSNRMYSCSGSSKASYGLTRFRTLYHNPSKVGSCRTVSLRDFLSSEET